MTLKHFIKHLMNVFFFFLILNTLSHISKTYLTSRLPGVARVG